MKTFELPPYAPTLIESTRAIGYSLEAAVADIIDNSIAAGASKVDLFFFPVDKEYVAILDNGRGMDDEEITTAMQYGSKNPMDERSKEDLGRFGFDGMIELLMTEHGKIIFSISFLKLRLN